MHFENNAVGQGHALPTEARPLGSVSFQPHPSGWVVSGLLPNASPHRAGDGTTCRITGPGNPGSARFINRRMVGTRLRLSYGSAIRTPRGIPVSAPPANISTECVETRKND